VHTRTLNGVDVIPQRSNHFMHEVQIRGQMTAVLFGLGLNQTSTQQYQCIPVIGEILKLNGTGRNHNHLKADSELLLPLLSIVSNSKILILLLPFYCKPLCNKL